MKCIYFLGFLLILAGCKDLSEPPEGKAGEECQPKAGLAPPCGETSTTRSLSLDCIHPQNDSVYWAIVEVYYDYEEGPAIDDVADFIYQNGKILYQRNVACPESCDPEECFKEFYSKPTTKITDLSGGYFIYYRQAGGENKRLMCPPPWFNTFRFCIVSDGKETKILSQDEFLDFIGDIDSYSEAIIRWRFPFYEPYSTTDPIKLEFLGINALEELDEHYLIDFNHSKTNYHFNEDNELDSCSTQHFHKKIEIAKATQEISVLFDTLEKEDNYRICNSCD